MRMPFLIFWFGFFFHFASIFAGGIEEVRAGIEGMT